MGCEPREAVLYPGQYCTSVRAGICAMSSPHAPSQPVGRARVRSAVWWRLCAVRGARNTTYFTYDLSTAPRHAKHINMSLDYASAPLLTTVEVSAACSLLPAPQEPAGPRRVSVYPIADTRGPRRWSASRLVYDSCTVCIQPFTRFGITCPGSGATHVGASLRLRSRSERPTVERSRSESCRQCKRRLNIHA